MINVESGGFKLNSFLPFLEIPPQNRPIYLDKK